MKLGIVGSRRRHSFEDGELIKKKILELKPSMIISGGCYLGADKFAEDFARELGIPITIFYPKLREGKKYTQEEIREAMYERNRQIAYESDHLIALVVPDRKGGTENTIGYFKRHGMGEDDLEIL
ncbi:hypothetical protein LCGC14_2176960 [marine sediment metagenome]|uniref:DUF2493 domain-containing protein n=1 Tax=marine sediment metagenome TaxID=412755 RepID=A0A0F9DNH0_9ZZZZ|nr:hypothetical protein [Candidatus Aminicenantes bacterium]HEB36114.1 hypothetical protein [Candidatus Aminicenantes bacterium]